MAFTPRSSAEPGTAPVIWMPRHSPWLIAAAVMLATILEILDTSVANVALPQMAGGLSVTPEEATWVLTSYLVANAIVLPMAGWLSSFFGRKRFLMTCVVAFTLASVACGSAPTMAMLILGRVIQGAAGGALQPLSQAILLESFPPHKRGVAMATFGMGVVAAPIIGPALGGWITDNYSWRWIFYINLPIGALALAMCQAFVEDPPYIRAAKQRVRGQVDAIGFGFMALWLATLQFVLDKGQEEDWFQTPWICWFTAISVVSMVAFIVWELRVAHPIVDLRVLRHRNFAVGTGMMALMGVVLYSSITLLPLYLQNLMGYPALNSGMAISPRGIGAIMSMVIVGRLIGKVDSRMLIGFGFALLAFAARMFGDIDLQIAMRDVVLPNIIMGFAMGFIFVPLTTMAMGELSNEEMGNATGIFNLMRNLGGSFGISAVTTFLARDAQTYQNVLSSHMNPYNPIFQSHFQSLRSMFVAQAGPVLGDQQAYAMLYGQLVQQATLQAFVENFRLLAYLCLLCLPWILLFKRVRAHAGPVAAH
jgi:DHA2 family multidrug resistance protein